MYERKLSFLSASEFTSWLKVHLYLKCHLIVCLIFLRLNVFYNKNHIAEKVKWDTILARLMDKYIVDIPQTERLKKELYGK